MIRFLAITGRLGVGTFVKIAPCSYDIWATLKYYYLGLSTFNINVSMIFSRALFYSLIIICLSILFYKKYYSKPKWKYRVIIAIFENKRIWAWNILRFCRTMYLFNVKNNTFNVEKILSHNIRTRSFIYMLINKWRSLSVSDLEIYI